MLFIAAPLLAIWGMILLHKEDHNESSRTRTPRGTVVALAAIALGLYYAFSVGWSSAGIAVFFMTLLLPVLALTIGRKI